MCQLASTFLELFLSGIQRHLRFLSAITNRPGKAGCMRWPVDRLLDQLAVEYQSICNPLSYLHCPRAFRLAFATAMLACSRDHAAAQVVAVHLPFGAKPYIVVSERLAACVYTMAAVITELSRLLNIAKRIQTRSHIK